MRYVLTYAQYNQAVVIGAAQLGVLPQDTNPEAVIVDVVENGAMIDVAGPEDAGGSLPPGPTSPRSPATAPANGRAAGASDKIVDSIRDGLVARMKRAPSKATIRTWDKKQIKEAKEWIAATEPVEGVATTPRPDFIIEPKARGSRGSGGGSGERASKSGSAAGSNDSDFFSADDEES